MAPLNHVALQSLSAQPISPSDLLCLAWDRHKSAGVSALIAGLSRVAGEREREHARSPDASTPHVYLSLAAIADAYALARRRYCSGK